MTSSSTTSRKAQIESYWAKGLGTHAIMAAIPGVGLDYVQNVVRLIQSHSRMIRETCAGNDDAKHLYLIATKHGEDFPVCFLPARTRMRA